MEKLTEKYRVAYDSNYQIFILHWERLGLPNMEFLMHDRNWHYYEPINKDLFFLENVSKNKELFIKWQTKSVFKYRKLQHTLVFPTINELKWIIRSNQIQGCPVETEYLDNAELVWGEYVTYLKGKMNRTKPI